jgi:hypothetical protein
LPDKDSIRVLDITVSIVYQGDFSTKGYKLGRIAVGLFRLVESNNSKTSASSSNNSIPVSVGYAPYSVQQLNSTTGLGRVVILHKPRKSPLAPGTFQIVIGAAASTKYSIDVSCAYAKTALPLVDEAVMKAKEMQSRLPRCLLELEGLEESLRLAERKLLICEKMILEAEVDTERCQSSMQKIMRVLEKDDENFTLIQDERKNFQRELSILEIEYAQWAHTFGSRNREKDDIKEGINMVHKYTREKLQEKNDIKAVLEQSRKNLPACIALLRSLTEASHVATALNTSVAGISAEAGAAVIGEYSGIKVSTPAEDVRRQMKQFGFESLLLEEQKWCLLDQVLNPSKYEWLKEFEEKERTDRELLGLKTKTKKINVALDQFRLYKAIFYFDFMNFFIQLLFSKLLFFQI